MLDDSLTIEFHVLWHVAIWTKEYLYNSVYPKYRMLLEINDLIIYINPKYYFIQASVELFLFNNIFDMTLVISMLMYVSKYTLLLIKIYLSKKVKF